MKDCSICKYCDIDYDFDQEECDEYPIYICQKRNDTSLDCECKDFEEYKPRKYIEEYTMCDKCKYFKECEEYLIECTTKLDNFNHYINGRGHFCKNDAQKPLTKQEFIELYNEMADKEIASFEEMLEMAISSGFVEDEKC